MSNALYLLIGVGLLANVILNFFAAIINLEEYNRSGAAGWALALAVFNIILLVLYIIIRYHT